MTDDMEPTCALCRFFFPCPCGRCPYGVCESSMSSYLHMMRQADDCICREYVPVGEDGLRAWEWMSCVGRVVDDCR